MSRQYNYYRDTFGEFICVMLCLPTSLTQSDMDGHFGNVTFVAMFDGGT